jgi:hypothetical protein
MVWRHLHDPEHAELAEGVLRDVERLQDARRR